MMQCLWLNLLVDLTKSSYKVLELLHKWKQRSDETFCRTGVFTTGQRQLDETWLILVVVVYSSSSSSLSSYFSSFLPHSSSGIFLLLFLLFIHLHLTVLFLLPLSPVFSLLSLVLMFLDIVLIDLLEDCNVITIVLVVVIKAACLSFSFKIPRWNEARWRITEIFNSWPPRKCKLSQL